MNASDVEKFYNDYKRSISTIAHLEQKLLQESYSYEKWYETLLQKSKTLREIYAQNLKEYQDVIAYVVEHPDELSPEVKHHLLTHIDFFLSEGYHDYGVTVPVLKAILPYWENAGIPGKKLDCNYFLGFALGDAHYYGEACNAFTHALESFDDIFDCPELYWTFRMMCTAYYRLVDYVGMDRYSEDVLLKYYNEAYALWTDDRIPAEMISDKKKKYLPSILRNIVCYAVSFMLDRNEIPSEELMAVVVEEFYFQKEKEYRQNVNCAAEVIYLKYLRFTGRYSVEDYEKKLTDIVNELLPLYDLGYSYGTWTFTSLYDHELNDDSFSADKLFYMNPSFAFVKYALLELLSATRSDKVKNDICHRIYRYFMELPPISGDGFIDTMLYPILAVFFAHCSDEDMLIDCALNLMVHRQISTAIHVTMVAKLSQNIVSRMVVLHPEYFVGCLGLNTVDDVKNNSDRLEKFAYKAGIIHDIGKLTCTDVITLQNRKILNEEFARVRVHPVAGTSLLLNSEAMFEYSFIALCHHVFDDGGKGYPEGVKLPDNPMRIFIEIVTVSDSVDAMSDTLGRNYAVPKPMETIVKELNAEKGTRYSARVVDTLRESEELMSDINAILYDDRVDVHFDIYRRFIRPDIKFRPEDEKFIAHLQDSTLNKISDMVQGGSWADAGQLLENTDEKIEDIFRKCRDYSFIITDSTGIIYGNILCEAINDNLLVRNIFVKPDSRRKGYGSMMLKHVENEAHGSGIKKIYLQEVLEEHNDKFGWHNGYSPAISEIRGWMLKKI